MLVKVLDSEEEYSNWKNDDGDDSDAKKWDLGSHNVVIDSEEMVNVLC